jgi:WD40 repeat protein
MASVPVSQLTLLHFTDRVSQLGYSPDGLHLAAAIDSGTLLVLNASTFVEELNLSVPFGWVSVSSLSWGPNSDRLAAGYEGGAVGVWGIPSGSPLWNQSDLYFDVRGVAWSPDGHFLAAGMLHSVFIYFGENGTQAATLNLDYGNSQPAGLSWSHDSDYIAVGQQAYAPTGAIVALYNANSWLKALSHRWVGPDMDSVAFEGRARFLAVHLGESRVEVWEVRNWTLFANVSSANGLEQFAWTVDGSRLATLETDPAAAPNTTEDLGAFEVLHLGGGTNNSSSMAISPDGRRVAIGYFDGSLRVLDVAGDRIFDDRTPIVATTGDPLTFDVRISVSAPVEVTFTDALGGRSTTLSLTAAGDRNTLTVTVPSDWSGTLLYRFAAPSVALTAPPRVVRVLDNDAPTVLTWNFTRVGATGAAGLANATVSDNLLIANATFQAALDGELIASQSVAGVGSANFALSFPISTSNRSVRLDLIAFDDAENGGTIFTQVIPLLDLIPPEFGPDLSEAGTAGGRIKLGIIATDDRSVPVVQVTYRELLATTEGPWTNFTFGVPGPSNSTYYATFPLSPEAVGVEYRFTAWDEAGHTNATPVRVLPVFDRLPPQIVLDLSDRQPTQGDVFHLGIAATDNIGVVEAHAFVQMDGGAVNQVDMTPWPAYGAGVFEGNVTMGLLSMSLTYFFSVVDAEGNEVTTRPLTLTVKDNDPPLLVLLDPVEETVVGSEPTVHIQVTDISPVSVLTLYYKREGEPAFFTETYAAPNGTKNWTVAIDFNALGVRTLHDGRAILYFATARDLLSNNGSLASRDDPLRIGVRDGAPPTARFAWVGALVAGSLVSFDASESDDDLGVTAYAWEVDGTAIGNGSSVSVRFGSGGEHSVKLTVSDASGKSNSLTQKVNVAQAPPVDTGLGAASVGIVVAAAVIVAAAAFVLMRRRRGEEGEP